MVTDTFFPVSVERLGLIVQDTPMQDDGQQVADELVEVEELVEDELDAEQETETDAEPVAEVGVDEVDSEAVADDFQDCVLGHQVESEPGPGPGPSLGPFCSDILSWLRCCKLAIRLVASRSSRKRTASLRQGPLIVVSANYRELRLSVHYRCRFHAPSVSLVVQSKPRHFFFSLFIYPSLSLSSLEISPC